MFGFISKWPLGMHLKFCDNIIVDVINLTRYYDKNYRRMLSNPKFRDDYLEELKKATTYESQKYFLLSFTGY